MGSASGYICRTCGARFQVRSGGGFFFDLLHCDTCGEAKSVGHQELGDIHLRFVKASRGRTRLPGRKWTAASTASTPPGRSEEHTELQSLA